MTPTASDFVPNTLTRLLGNADYVKTILLGMDLHCEIFQDDQKRPVAVLWSSLNDVDHFRTRGPMINLSSLPAGTQIYTAMGRKLEQMPITKELSPFPFFLQGKPGNLDKLVASLNNIKIKGKQFQPLLASFTIKNISQSKITLKNIRDKPFKGKLVIVDQSKENAVLINQEIDLASREKWTQNLPLTWPTEGILSVDYALNIKSDSGDSLFKRQVKMEVIKAIKLDKVPTIDGNLNDWPAKAETILPNRFKSFKTSPTRDKVQRTMIPRNGDADLSATLFAGWHPSGLYLAVKVRDNDHTPLLAKARRYWTFDCVQLYFDGWFDAREHPKAGFDHNDQALDILPLPDGTVRVNRSVAPEQQLGFLKTGLNTKIKAAFKRTQDGYSIYGPPLFYLRDKSTERFPDEKNKNRNHWMWHHGSNAC